MEERHRFDIDPHVVRQLGEELVPDEITALMELVKNSYDADATWVSIELNTSGSYNADSAQYPNHNGFITIKDDGFGMNKETIVKSWLLISYSSKREMKSRNAKTPKGRTPLGEKGLGRLSTQRLAEFCEIKTIEEGTQNKVIVSFNWKDFESSPKLSEVPVQVSEQTTNEPNGTEIVLLNLKQPNVWKSSNLERFKAQLSMMISPYQENKPFQVYLTINSDNIDLSQENENLRDLAISRFKFYFDGNKLIVEGKIKPEKLIGNTKKSLDSYIRFIAGDKGKKFSDFFLSHYNKSNNENQFFATPNQNYFLGFKKEIDFDQEVSKLEYDGNHKANPGNFFGEIDEFNFSSKTYHEEKNSAFDSLSNFKEFAKNQVGIKIYRNGFAVQPYGFSSGLDWMKLGAAQTSGGSYYGLRPHNTIGYFAIDEGVNSNLRDKTDRNGFIETPYSKNFLELSFLIRNECSGFLESIRRKYNEYLEKIVTANNKIKTVSQAFDSINNTANSVKNIKFQFSQTKQTIEKIKQDTSSYLMKVEDDPIFATDIERQVAEKVKNIFNELKLIEDTIIQMTPIIEASELLPEIIDVLKPKIEILEEQLENFSSLAAIGLLAESISHEFNNVADSLSDRVAVFSNKLQKGTFKSRDAFILIEYVNTAISGLRTLQKHVDPTLKYKREKNQEIDLLNYFTEEKNYYEKKFEKSGIKLDIKTVDNFAININKGKLTQIIDNILNNSEYWLLDKQKDTPGEESRITIIIEKPWVSIYDNGYGIANSIENTLFEPFATMKPRELGRGLGLFIVQQLLDSIGCMITVDPKNNHHNRKYIFLINFSNIIK